MPPLPTNILKSHLVCVSRCVYSAAAWYYNHLAGAMNVVMITDKQDTVAQYSSLKSGVFVVTLQVINSAP